MPKPGRNLRKLQSDRRRDDEDARPAADADAAAFAEAVRDVRPLPGASRVRLIPARASGTVPVRPPAVPTSGVPSTLRGALKWEVSDGGEAWSARADGVDARVLRKLRAEDFPIEAELDLHGHTRARATTALERFLAAARASGRRCVMIIHGRGLHSGEEGPALRDAVRAALTTGNQAVSVLACCTAPRARGGAGATLVLLRR